MTNPMNEIERAVIGLGLEHDDARETILRELAEADFHAPSARRVYRTFAACKNAGEPADTLLLARRMDPPDLKAVGGVQALIDLIKTDFVPTCTLGYYVHAIQEASRIRSLKDEAARLAGDSSLGYSADELQDRLMKSIRATKGGLVIRSLADVTDAFLAGLDAKPVFGTLGFGEPSLDGPVGGMRQGELIIVAARPSVGKTAAACAFALTVAEAGHSVLFVSREMSEPQLLARMLASRANVEHERIRDNDLCESEIAMVRCAAKHIRDLPISFVDRNNLRVADIEAAVAWHQPKLLIVDYLGIVTPINRRDPREQQVAAMSAGFKAIAKRFQIPVMLLHQLNRESVKGSEREPELTDLRESGSVEQDADVVILLHAKRPAKGQDYPAIGDLTFLVRKNRNGRTGRAILTFDRTRQRIGGR